MSTATLDMNSIRAQGWNDRSPTLGQLEGGGYVMMRGHAGPDVQRIGERLQSLGYDIGTKEPDGKYGTGLEAAVVEFQRRNKVLTKDGKVDTDGKVGHNTYAKLFADDAKPGPGLVSKDGVCRAEATSAEKAQIARATAAPTEIKTDAQLQDALVSARTAAAGQDPRVLGSANAFKLKTATGYKDTNNATLKDYRGETITKGATVTNAVGGKVEATLGEVQGKAEAYKFGVSGRAGIDASAQFGGYTAEKSNAKTGDFAVAGSVGAYAGVDAGGELNLSARYFGAGVKGSVGKGVGAQAQGHWANEDGVASASLAARGGIGATVGGGIQTWVDYGQMKRDYDYVAGKVESGVSWAGDQISNAWKSMQTNQGTPTY